MRNLNSFTKKHLQSLKRGAAMAVAAGSVSAPCVPVSAHAAQTSASSASESEEGVSISTFFKVAAAFVFSDHTETAYFLNDSWIYSRPYDDAENRVSVSKYESIKITGVNSGEFWRAETGSGKTCFVKKEDVTTDSATIQAMKQQDATEKENQEEKEKEAEKSLKAFQEEQKKLEEKRKKEEEKKKKEEEEKKKQEALEKAREMAAEKLKQQQRLGKLEPEEAKQSLEQAESALTQAEQEKIDAILSQDVGESEKGEKAIEIAKTKLGHRYVFGASGPDVFDCSGFTGWVYRQLGVSLPRSAAEQYSATQRTDTPSTGDLVFFKNTYKPGISHVGIVIGDGMMIHAASSKRGLIISSYKSSYYSRHFAGFGKMSS